ncbi:hypothetical protein [Flavobacterium sp. NKUCC04_CG]|uniref:hypothetical protein n=1 Tax=Flavobacterium sp. NKUCC04_CG TaxID=2842121 RepID=UPI001C5BA859|nr:hypothetical protein [Flavobacterium sp. NKUCC04_CG]MBW3519578.1 hypothetical protein [Flavobacterium sp. NKUCC04_CG]
MKKSWLICCLINFFLAAMMGVLLRYAYVLPIEINYTFLLHGHSHTAMLGWVYLMLYSLIFYEFIPKTPASIKRYNRLFWITQFSIIGMIFSFPLQGYALVSIGFSTLHIFCSYFFLYLVWQGDKSIYTPEKKLLCTALFFMLFSTLGVWCLGPVAASGAKGSAFYQSVIQFFIHFQFNGWFIFGVLAILIKKLRVNNCNLNPIAFKWFLYLLIFATLLTFSLPLSWYFPFTILPWINGLGLVLQGFSIYAFYRLIRPHYSSLITLFSKTTTYLYAFALISLALKITIQSLTLFPDISAVSHEIRNFVIGFTHLTSLGVITGFLLAFVSDTLAFQTNLSKAALLLFLICFATTEILLFTQGALTYFERGIFSHYHLLLLLASIGLPLALALLILSLIKS